MSWPFRQKSSGSAEIVNEICFSKEAVIKQSCSGANDRFSGLFSANRRSQHASEGRSPPHGSLVSRPPTSIDRWSFTIHRSWMNSSTSVAEAFCGPLLVKLISSEASGLASTVEWGAKAIAP